MEHELDADSDQQSDSDSDSHLESHSHSEPDSEPDSDSAGAYPISPLLKQSDIDPDGRVEIGIFMSGSGQIEENELNVFLKHDRIDPGEHIELGVFVSGIGAVEESSVSVFHDRTGIINLSDPGTVTRNVNSSSEGSDAIVEAQLPVNGEDVNGGVSENSQSVMFQQGTQDSDYALQWDSFEGSNEGEYGYIFEISTRESAPPGDYSLPVVFTYRSETGVKQVKQAPTIHINTWREQHEPWITRGTILVAGLSILGVVLYTFSLFPI